MDKPILCVDFDGVIHSYTSPWKGPGVISDPPVRGAIAWLCQATRFFNVHIYSSRSKTREGIDAMSEYIQEHGNAFQPRLGNNLVELLTFSHEKPAAFLTIDDRAVCFDGDWSKLNPEKLREFKPWNKR